MTVAIAKGSFSEGLASAGEAIKNAALWLGRMIKLGFEKCVEGIKTAWNTVTPYIKEAAIAVGRFLTTAPGFALMSGLVGVVLGVTAETIKDNKYATVAMRTFAALAFVGTGIAIGLGIAKGFTTPLV